MRSESEVVAALEAVLERFASFNRLGALRGEGGERAFRSWLITRFLTPVFNWPWDRLVAGESLDLLALDWRDFPVVYIETKTPTGPLRVGHRSEMASRLPRWGRLRVVYLTNGREWERFDLVNELSKSLETPTSSYVLGTAGTECMTFFDPLAADRYVR